jgi:gliding motility-associated-like protein
MSKNKLLSKLAKSLQIILFLFTLTFINSLSGQTYVTWTTGADGTIIGTFPGGTVTASITGTGNGITLGTPSSFTNFLNTTGTQTFSTFGPRDTGPSKKLTFNFSTPVIVTKFNMNDIDKGSQWDDSFLFENIVFTSTTCTNCISTVNGSTANSTSSAVSEYGYWFDSTLPVTDFSLNYLTTNNLTHAFLGYSMEVIQSNINIVSINSPTICSSQLATITASNTLPGTYSYDWSVPSGATNPGNVNTFTTSIPGTYSVIVTNTTTGQVNTPVSSVVTISSFINNTFNQIQPICAGDTFNLPLVSNEGIAGTWSPTIDNNQTTTYTFTPTSNFCSSTEQMTVIVNQLVSPTLNSPQLFCVQDNATLNDIVISGININWYNSPTSGSILPTSTTLQNGVTYYATQTINNCESNRVPVLIQVQNTNAPAGNTNQLFCATDEATLNSINIIGTNIQWYSSLTSTTPLPNNTPLTDGITYYASQTVNNCESINRLPVTIEIIFTLNASNYLELICDELNDGVESINLSNFNSNLISTSGNTFSYYHSSNGAINEITTDEIINHTNYNLNIGTEIFYVRIVAPNSCYQVVELTLELVSKPFILIDDSVILCENNNVQVDAGSGYDAYLWSTGETNESIIIQNPGNYSVTVSENFGTLTCSTTKNFTVVLSNPATISGLIPTDWTSTNNTITVNITGLGDYEYSLNNIDYQDSNIFTNLENGEYTVYVRDKNGCGISNDEVYLLMYPKYFTPNGDGYNDFWKIKFSENEPNLTVKIFDRYGKFIKELDTNSIGWDGTYQGQKAISSDFWFLVIRENGKEHRGHFSLIR